MKALLSKLFRGTQNSQEIYDESIERLADILVANYEARQRSRCQRNRLQAA